MSETKQTTDISKIKQWTKDRDGEPTVIKETGDGRKGAGVLRIHFPKSSDHNDKTVA